MQPFMSGFCARYSPPPKIFLRYRLGFYADIQIMFSLIVERLFAIFEIGHIAAIQNYFIKLNFKKSANFINFQKITGTEKNCFGPGQRKNFVMSFSLF